MGILRFCINIPPIMKYYRLFSIKFGVILISGVFAFDKIHSISTKDLIWSSFSLKILLKTCANFRTKVTNSDNLIMHLNLLKVPSCAHFPRQSISLRRFFSSSSQFMSHFNAFNVINATYILFNSQFGHCQWSFNASSRTYECGAKF